MVPGNIYSYRATISLTCVVLSMPSKSRLTYFIDYIYCSVTISSYFPGFLLNKHFSVSSNIPKAQAAIQYSRVSINSMGRCWVITITLSWIGYLRACHLVWTEHTKPLLHQEGFCNFYFPCEYNLSIFTEVTSVLRFKPLCCICFIPGTFPFLDFFHPSLPSLSVPCSPPFPSPLQQ